MLKPPSANTGALCGPSDALRYLPANILLPLTIQSSDPSVQHPPYDCSGYGSPVSAATMRWPGWQLPDVIARPPWFHSSHPSALAIARRGPDELSGIWAQQDI